MDAATRKIVEQVADRMIQLRLESALNSKTQILIEAFRILRELGEDEVADLLFATSKRIGSKLEKSQSKEMQI